MKLEGLIEARAAELDAAEISARLSEDAVDVTLPGAPRAAAGHLHLITRTRRQIEDIMVGLGYRVLEGPEVELDYYNFTALNHPPGHPARMEQDTFYVAPGSLTKTALEAARAAADSAARDGAATPDEELVVLRTHTSPMQVRAMEAQEPPIFMIGAGQGLSPRHVDATHLPMFHQIEGLAVAEDITLADLQGTLREMLRGHLRRGAARPGCGPHFFPFTEPSVEFDVSCFPATDPASCADGSRCRMCKGIGWVEVGGAGMVDPNVFGFVATTATTPTRSRASPSASGSSGSRCCCHGVPDLRRFFENDVRMLEQFA